MSSQQLLLLTGAWQTKLLYAKTSQSCELALVKTFLCVTQVIVTHRLFSMSNPRDEEFDLRDDIKVSN